MTDRFPQYSVIPNFNNPALLQQQQSQQSHQQGQQQQPHQQPDHQSFPDQSRMWQMQQQQQFRPSSGMDMSQGPQQANQQMQGLFAGARMNAQTPQMPQQGQSQPQFGLSMSPQQAAAAGAMGSLGANHQQSFSDGSSNNQSQSAHMANTGFPNMGPVPNQNPGLNAASVQQRNPALLMQNNGHLNRQLELMLAQPQNSVLFNAAKLNQQSSQIQQNPQSRDQQHLQPAGVNQPGSVDIFSSPAMPNEAIRRPSPSHPSNMNPMQGAPQHPPPGMQHASIGINPTRRAVAPMTIQEVNERLTSARQHLVTAESEMHNILTQMRVAPTAELRVKFRNLQGEVEAKREFIARMVNQQQYQSGGLADGMSRVPGQTPWNQQGVHPQGFEKNGNMGRGNGLPQQNAQLPPGSHPQSSNGPNPTLHQQPLLSNHLLSAGNVPRSGPTPNPPGMQAPSQLGSPFPGPKNVQAAMANKQNFPMNFNPTNGNNGAGNPTAAMPQRPMSMGNSAWPPPFEKAKFDTTFNSFMQRKGMKIDQAPLSVNDQRIDLAHLHAIVMTEGGYQKVNDTESWHIVGGRMGFVQFPGSDREPDKSGPGVAQHLAHVYREYLLEFEQSYLRSFAANPTFGSGNPNAANAIRAGMHPNMNVPRPGPNSGVAGLPGSAPNGNGPPLHRPNPQMLQYANLSSAELHSRGVPENIIAVVEQNRGQLQRIAQENKRFQTQVRQARNASGVGSLSEANGLQNGLDPQTALLRQQMLLKQQQMAAMSRPGIQHNLPIPNPLLVRNPDNAKAAIELVNRMKEDFKKGPQLESLLGQNYDIPYEQRNEFNNLLGATYRHCIDLNDRLHMLHLLIQSPQTTQKAVAFCSMISTQRQFLSGGQPRFILTLDTLRQIAAELHKILEMFSHQQQVLVQRTQYLNHLQQHAHQAHVQQAGQQSGQQMSNPLHQAPGMQAHPNGLPPQMPQPHPGVVPNNMNNSAQSPPEGIPRSNMVHPSPQLHPHHAPPTSQQPHQMSMGPQHGMQSSPAVTNRSVPVRKGPTASTPNNTAPSPAAAASTPATTNAPTPTATATSPSAPKSPKGKTMAKPKQPVRRKSKSQVMPSTIASKPPSSTPAPEQMQPQTSTSTNGSMKRPREEDDSNTNGSPYSPGNSNGASDQPSPPKRPKVDWDGPPNEELQQRNTMVNNIKTEEDANTFLVHMAEIIKMAQNDSQQEPEGLSDTLNNLLKGCGTVPGNIDESAISYVTPLSPMIPKDEFEKYFDFTLGGTQQDGEDDDSKTPELISSSSTTNPSPGSNSGNEAVIDGAPNTAGEAKTDDLDLTRLGLWKEIDGGESAFFQPIDWKWDGPMNTLDQPWPIFT